MFRHAGVVLVVLCILTHGGCRSGTSADQGPREYAVPGVVLQSLPANLSEFQKGILEDGGVTFAEYESAVFAHIACLRDAGIELVEGPLLEVPFQTYFFTYSDPLARPGYIAATATKCHGEFLMWVEAAWTAAAPPDEETVNAISQFLAECFSRAGLEVELSASLGELREAGAKSDAARKVGSECRRQTEQRYGFRVWRFPS